ncbi:MAG TPA: ABC transporter permease [Euzebyales bacterium]|nr:ABC transporter permease [Euzebyales bacterium]
MAETEARQQVALPGERVAAGTLHGWRRVAHYATMPMLLTIVIGALALWVGGQELDSIEQRELQRTVLIDQTQRHVMLALLSTVLVLVLAVPLGILATRPRTRRLAPLIIGLGNAGQAVPSLGMLALIFFLFRTIPALPSTGVVPVVAALTAYSFLPILRNTMVGLDTVDRDVLEAGRGMGMSTRQVLLRLELPLAVPVILAGVRTALVLNVGTATLAYLFGGGGLGDIIFSGFQLRRTPVLITGAVLTAVLALLIDYVAGLFEEWLTPEGLD